MITVGIDPGTTQSAYVAFDGERVIESMIVSNEDVLTLVQINRYDQIVCEMIQSYGMPVGKETFETVYWIGRFAEASAVPFHRIYRGDVKMHFCHSMRAKDSNVRQALIDRFPPSGGGKTPQVGTTKQKGPLYGVKSHAWQALAAAIAWRETR